MTSADSAHESTGPVPVHRMFERRAALDGGAPALVSAAGETSYRELDRRADGVAARLLRSGIGPGDLVGVRVRRGPGMIAAMLGVLKAGAAYVPVDPGDPEERSRHVIAESGMKALVSDGPAGSPGAEGPLLLDADGGQDADGQGAGGAVPDDLDAAAYALFTSGSTGTPKGAAMTHRALANLLSWHDRTRPGCCSLRTLQFCAISFDFSFHEIFSTLCFGGTLVLPGEEVRRDPDALAAHLAEHRVQRLFLPVTPLVALAEALRSRPRDLDLREVVTTGERLRLTPALRAMFHATGARLHNHYGATEFQDATAHTLSGPVRDWPEEVPAGRPIDNVSVHVLDPDGEPLPPGAEGELHIGGVGVSPGYVGRPDLTAERFVDGPGDLGRLYRTGDLASIGEDGVLRLLGRADDQVKVNGVRFEPGEVEALLLAHPEVADAAVAVSGEAGAQRITAYVVLRDGAEPEGAERRLHRDLSGRLTRALRPSAYVVLDAMPLTSSGKKDRRALPAPAARARLLDAPAERTGSPTEEAVAGLWREVLGLAEVGAEDNFFDVGGTSALLLELRARIADRLGAELTAVDLFRAPTVRALARRVDGGPRRAAARARTEPAPAGRGAVAIVGMSGRFPGADGIEEFWRALRAGEEGVVRFGEAGLEQTDPALAGHPDYVRAAAPLREVAGFDAAFFGIGAREAATIDPQQRVFLECAWEACEDAGLVPGAGSDRVGVFAGSSMSTYLMNNVAPAEGLPARGPLTEADIRQFQIRLGNDRNYLATRVSYLLGLNGPGVNVQTACSTSLVAVHQACRSLLDGECDAALAGGVSIAVPQRTGYLYEEGMIRSPDGRCRPFDAEASGTLFGNGCGVVLLKRLSDALADGDDVRAVILGSAVNNDGADKVGFTAPSVERQAEVVEQALRNARIDPAGIGYVEAHGTGTALGDPIEIAALTEAFGRAAAAPLPRGGCAVGSVKSNIGHLDEAAGVAGLIKAALAVRHGEIPATLHVRRPNPRIGFEETPFYVNTRLRPWPQGPGPRRAGVSSFGMGGTNCHAVLEEPPAGQAAAGTERRPQIILVSARTPEGLGEAARRHAAHLAGGRAEPLADVAATAATGRRHFEHRAAVVADTPEQARELLLEAARGSAPAAARSTAFLYGGQGSHSTAMGLELYRSLPVFRDALDACAEALRPHLPSPLLPEMFAGGDGTGPGPLEDTAWAQPALFAIGYALTRTWRALGVRPDVVIGHSIGEYAAAEAAGVLTLEDAAALVAARGRLMAALPRGAMVAVEAGPEEVAPLLRGAERHAAVAAVNGERATVLSGERAAVRRIAAELRERGTRCKELAVSHAFHSPMMDPAAERFAEVAEGVGFSAPHTPIVSTVTGGLIGDEIARPDHWVRNVREPVLFSAGLAAVEEFGAEAFVELSARPVLLGLLYGRDGEGKGPRVPSMRAGREREQLLRAAGELHRAGMQIDWSQVYPRGAHRRVALPTYPWRRRRYWIDPPAPAAPDAAPAAPGTHPVLGGRIELPESREARFTSVVGPRRLPWLADHRVFDTLVLPGVAYIEAALSAARAITGEPEQELTDFVIHRAMTFPDEDAERTVQVVAEPDGKGAHRLKILSREGASPDPAREWTLHASAVLARPAAGARPEEAERTPAAAGEELDPEEIYRGERGRGIDLGPRFHATAELRRDGTSCTSRIRLPDSERGDAGRYGVHPVLLEACFLALTVAYPRRHLRRTYVPAGAERIRWSAPIPPDVRCEAHIRPDEDGDAEALRGDVRLVGPDGGTLLSMEGILLKRAERTAMVGGGQPWRKWLYRTVWRPDPLPAGGGRADGEHWLVLSGTGLGPALARAARERGARCTLAAAGEPPTAALDRLLAEGGSAGAPPTAVIDCRAAEAPDGPPPDEAVRAHGERALALLQALARTAAGPPAAVLVTRGAQGAGEGPTAAPEQSALWGMAQAASRERTDLALSCVDLDPRSGAEEQAAALAAEVAACRAAPRGGLRTALRGTGPGGRRTARLESFDPPAGEAAVPRIDGSGTHLVTGGLGGLGLRFAGWLAEAGARHLVLAGRNGPGLDAEPAVKALREAGVRVEVLRADVSDAGQARGLVEAVRALPGLPPLRGVAHLAGVLDDGALTALTPARLARTTAVKATGAWHLHRACAGEELDYLLLFSSMSALLGAAGQVNYAAANAFLDGLASRLRGAGVPALSVQWGSWAETGMSAREEDPERAARDGERALAPAQALAALGWLLGAPPPDGVAAVLDVDWARRRDAHRGLPPLTADLAPESGDRPGPAAAQEWRIEAAPPGERRELLAARVRDALAGVLGTGGDIDPRARFATLGLDSVSSIELRNGIQEGLGIRLDLTLAFDHPTLADLTEYLCDRVLGPEPAPPAPPGAGEAGEAGEDGAAGAARRLAEKLGVRIDGAR